ncbi:MAG: TadE/TadG family type IV pilus assembly protein [Anaerolineaceae bacterium]
MKYRGNAQSIVEFALILPIMLLLIMGALDLGRAFYMKIALVNSAREGAYYLSYHPTDKTNCDPINTSFCYLGTRDAVIKEAYSAGMTVQSADIAINNCCVNGEPVEVIVSSQIHLKIFDFMFGPLALSHTARMKMLK